MLHCSGAEVRREAIPKRGGKLTSYLDFTKVSSRKNISALAVLFYRKFRYDSRGPGQVVWTRETGK